MLTNNERTIAFINKFNPEKLLKHGQGLFIGMIGALIIVLISHVMAPPSRIGTVNITGIVDQFVKSQAKRNLPPEQLKARVKAFGTTLEITLHDIADKNHVTLLPSEAVIAGSTDYTALVESHLQNLN